MQNPVQADAKMKLKFLLQSGRGKMPSSESEVILRMLLSLVL